MGGARPSTAGRTQACTAAPGPGPAPAAAQHMGGHPRCGIPSRMPERAEAPASLGGGGPRRVYGGRIRRPGRRLGAVPAPAFIPPPTGGDPAASRGAYRTGRRGIRCHTWGTYAAAPSWNGPGPARAGSESHLRGHMLDIRHQWRTARPPIRRPILVWHTVRGSGRRPTSLACTGPDAAYGAFGINQGPCATAHGSAALGGSGPFRPKTARRHCGSAHSGMVRPGHTHGRIPHGQYLVPPLQGSCETRRVWRRRHSMAPPALGSGPVGTVWKGPERHAAGGTHWSVDDMAGSTDRMVWRLRRPPIRRGRCCGVCGCRRHPASPGHSRARPGMAVYLLWPGGFSGGSVRHGMRHIPRHIPAGPPGSARRHARSAGRGISGPIGGCAVYNVPVRPRRRADPSPVWRHEVLLVPPQHLRRGMCVEWRPKRAPACVQYGPRRRGAELLFGVQTCVVGRVQEEHGRITHRPLRTTVRGAGWTTSSTNTIWS